MALPKPTDAELARAGALIAAVREGDRKRRDLERSEHSMRSVGSLAGFFAVLAPLTLVFLALDRYDGPESGGAALLIAAIATWSAGLSALSIWIYRKLEYDRGGFGFSPRELAELVGFVDLRRDGRQHVTPLGEKAVWFYYSLQEQIDVPWPSPPPPEPPRVVA